MRIDVTEADVRTLIAAGETEIARLKQEIRDLHNNYLDRINADLAKIKTTVDHIILSLDSDE